jgi:hypothetical protein
MRRPEALVPEPGLELEPAPQLVQVRAQVLGLA